MENLNVATLPAVSHHNKFVIVNNGGEKTLVVGDLNRYGYHANIASAFGRGKATCGGILDISATAVRVWGTSYGFGPFDADEVRKDFVPALEKTFGLPVVVEAPGDY